ncbi:TetR/AcrR family transcriptional regulator [Phenylobacterium sp.]|uniref:TetR/AcrR family transcriptional regulator n=1 Tax=Phenylobacterium sp. TaxID=1871053 RepID=UPI00289E2298|nr:TetR/AcrR family transcriptional regulator [Phenylobacterium sp.]
MAGEAAPPGRKKRPSRAGAAGRRTQAERSAETQRRLIDAAVTVLHRVGYGATTSGLIAEEAGVSRGAMLHQYPTKVDLMLAVVSDVYARETSEYQRRGRQADSPRERFYKFPEMMWDVLTRPSAMAVLEIMMGSRSDAELAARLAPLQRQIEATSKQTVEQILREGDLPDIPEFNAMRRLFVAAVRGLSIDLMLVKDRAELEQSIILLQRFLRGLYEGVLPPAKT